MRPAIDPRRGDIEDDASSSKRRSLLSLAGSLFAEISLPKLAVAFTLLVAVPALTLGIAPILAAIWFGKLSGKLATALTGFWPAILLAELWSQVWQYVSVRPEAMVYPTSATVAYLSEHKEPLGRVLAVDSPEDSTGLPKVMLEETAGAAKPKVNTARNPFGAGEPLALRGRLESLRGFP